MSLAELNVGIVGGSISGCAAARAFASAGCRVSIFERSARGLKERGSGIGVPVPLLETLKDRGYLPPDYVTQRMSERWWQYPDAGDPEGRTLAVQPTPAAANNWGLLWQALRANVSDDVYHEGIQLIDFEDHAAGVTARFSDGKAREFDLLVAADGYRSLCRERLHPDSTPDFANYVLWRGNYPEDQIAAPALIARMDARNAWLTIPFKGGHGVIYMIPDARQGKRRLNWAIYTATPPGLALDGVSSVPPGAVTAEVFSALEAILERDFPTDAAALIRGSRRADISIQPIFDSIVDTYCGAHVMLVGDAGSMTRPHTASGATKALEDVLAIEDLLNSETTLEGFLSAYDAARCATAQTVARIGRRIGAAQVIDTPDWARMGQKDFDTWIAATLSGDKLYLYGEDEAGEAHRVKA